MLLAHWRLSGRAGCSPRVLKQQVQDLRALAPARAGSLAVADRDRDRSRGEVRFMLCGIRLSGTRTGCMSRQRNERAGNTMRRVRRAAVQA